LDAGGLSALARRNAVALARIRAFRREGLWPPVVPSVVLVESLTGKPRADVNVNRLLKACEILEHVPEHVARRAASLRAQAQRGSAVDALVIAAAEPGGDVLSGDLGDLRALAAFAVDVKVHRA
jgi:hypothetical protein